MKEYARPDLEGRDFFKQYLYLYLPLLILLGISTATEEKQSLVSTLASLGQSYLSILLGFAFFRFTVIRTRIGGETFSFTGTLEDFAPRALKWFLLTVITFGIYSPWYSRNLCRYYLENSRLRDRNGEFLSTPGTLLKYLLLFLYLPIAVLMGLTIYFAIRYGWSETVYGHGRGIPYPGKVILLGLGSTALIFLIMIPFIYFYISWIINFRFAGFRVTYRRDIAPTCLFFVGQFLLCLISLFIYYPAAVVKTYRFIAEGSRLHGEGEEERRGGFGFDGRAGEGFLLIWGQGLLTLFTLGIYGPWAFCRVAEWFLSRTWGEVLAAEG